MSREIRPAALPEGNLIRAAREAAPRMPVTRAAKAAGISPTRWRQLESGVRQVGSALFPETGPAETIARMARVVGVTPAGLVACGRPDAGAELAVLPSLPEISLDQMLEVLAMMRHLEQRVSALEAKHEGGPA